MPQRKRTAKTRTTRRPVKPAPQPPLIPAGQRLWILEVPYAERGVATSNGAKWDAYMRQTIFVGETLPYGLTPYAAPAFSWARFLEEKVNGQTEVPPSPNTSFVPRPHQIEAVEKILSSARAGARGFLLADDVGLGKTLSAWQAVLDLRTVRPVKRVLVVCPLAVVPHWRRTIADVGAPGMQVVVINYDRLKNLLEVPESAKTAKRKSTQNRRTAREGKSLVDWDVVVFDEAHKLRNRDSQRTQSASRIAGYGERREDAPFVLWLSATIAHAPVEMSFLAPILAQASKSSSTSLKDFGAWLEEKGFHVTHDPRFDRWMWTDSPQERQQDIATVRGLLFERKTPLALRRLPTDISGWPEVTRSLLPVELDPASRRLYEEAWTEFRREMRLSRKGNDPKSGMVARLRFRQKASLLRIDGTVEQALDLLDNGHQVIISCQFLESLDLISSALEKHGVATAVMDGRDPGGREQQRLAFQRGQAKVVLVTPVEGYSLHQEEILPDGSLATSAPRSLVVHDLRFSGIEQAQLEGRGHRDGKAAHVYLAFGAETVEEDVARVLLQRVESMKSMVGDETGAIKELELVLEGSLKI